MVYPDISSSHSAPTAKANEYYIARVTDRILSFILDGFLMTSVIAFMVSSQLRYLRSFELEGKETLEYFVAVGLFLAATFFSVVFLQAIVIYFFKGTPGQRFLRLRLINMAVSPGQTQLPPLTFPQSVLRSFLWTLSLLFVIPFLEVFSHPHRRAFYDRAADTMVVSTWPTGDLGPRHYERQFVASFMRTGFIGLMFFIIVPFIQVNQMVRAGFFTRQDLNSQGITCQSSSPNDFDLSQRLDFLVALHMLGNEESDCLSAESDVALWNKSDSNKAMAYLVKLYLSEDLKAQDKYAKYICENYAKDEACYLAKSMTQGKEAKNWKNLEAKAKASLAAQVLIAQRAMSDKNFEKVAKVLMDLNKIEGLAPYLDHMYVQTAWLLNTPNSTKARAPASEETDLFLKDFKEKFEVP